MLLVENEKQLKVQVTFQSILAISFHGNIVLVDVDVLLPPWGSKCSDMSSHHHNVDILRRQHGQ